jgi:hypothetical protein
MPRERLDLPSDLVDFLTRGAPLIYDTFKCECGQVTLLPLDNLALATIDVEPTSLRNDPHRGEDGNYAVPAVNLIAAAEHYDPEFILCWIPKLEQFATYDTDHQVLQIFPDIHWTDIAADPLTYVNAQWNPRPTVPPKLWPHFPFKHNRLR